jgi:hypothetical protein
MGRMFCAGSTIRDLRVKGKRHEIQETPNRSFGDAIKDKLSQAV